MKPNLPLTLLGAALLAVPAVFGQATSGVMGFSTLSCPAGTTLVVPTLVNSSVFQGQAAISSDGLTITPTIAPGWTSGAYNATSFAAPTPNYPKFYAEVVSGPNEGLILDISSNTTTALTMVAAVAPAGIHGTTVQIAIREHVTLDKLVQGSSGLSDYQDGVLIFNPNGTQTSRTYANPSWVAEDSFSAAGHTVIYPGTGVALTCVAPVTFSFMGEVKPTKTQVPLYVSSVNIAGPLNPASTTSIFANSIRNSLTQYADGFSTYTVDGSINTSQSYYTDGTDIYNLSGNPLTGGSPDAIALNRGITVTVVADTVWTINSPLNP